MDKRAAANILLAMSIFSVAAAIIYFTRELVLFRGELPTILHQIESTSEKVDPILDEVAAIREQIPLIMDEMAAIRKEVPGILDEVENTRALVPGLLAESAQIRQLVPGTLKTIDNASDAIRLASRQVKSTQPLVSDVLKEVEATRAEIAAARKMIPTTMDRLEGVVEKADKAGQKATEGAVSGVITGIIKAPFKAIIGIGDVASGGKQLSDSDIRKATTTAIALARLDVGATKAWENRSTGNSGVFTLLRKYQEKGLECESLKHEVRKDKNFLYEKQLEICRKSSDDSWELKENM
ncbi:MAG: hypothetical protein KZQ93_04040 [Candidatus Thiodiazotropha sp. (ex Monitilora ramsayi)]|nr:hypothetical protein [Candidatus Thiodiazotropha sp. (ex Monitilora ramsayi)]